MDCEKWKLHRVCSNNAMFVSRLALLNSNAIYYI